MKGAVGLALVAVVGAIACASTAAPAPVSKPARATVAPAPAPPATTPAPPATTPAPPLAARGAPSVEQLRALLGKPPGGRAATDLLGPLSRNQTIRKFSDCYAGAPPKPCTFYIYPPDGFDLRIGDDVIDTVFLYSAGAEDHVVYGGSLPRGLTWLDTRGTVEAKLGPPLSTGGGGVISFYADYDDLQVTYREKSTTDLDNPLHHIALFRSRAETKPDVRR